MLAGILADDLSSAAAAWLFNQPAAIAVAVLAAGVACCGLYWFANLHANTIGAATADMKAGMASMADAFSRDQERDKEVFVRELEKNRELVRDVMQHHERQGRA